MLEKLIQATSIRGAKHEAGRIYKEHTGQKGREWGQAAIQKMVMEIKTKIKGTRPARRARSRNTDGEMSTW